VPELDEQNRKTIEVLYQRFNERKLDQILALLRDDVDWPNALDGGRVHGREALAEYWARQATQIQRKVEPLEITARDDGAIEVRAHEVVTDPQGDLIGQGEVLHVFTFEGGRVARMDLVALDDLGAGA
jgi:hypothetical protein